MTLPEGVQPSGSEAPEPTVVETFSEPTVAKESMVTEPATTDESMTAPEDSSDAALRAWAKDNGIDGVPASGKLSASWRDQITAAMAEAQAEDPKAEASVGDTSSEPPSGDGFFEEDEDSAGVAAFFDSSEKGLTAESVAPEFEPVEYRSVFKAPSTWVTSQAFTS